MFAHNVFQKINAVVDRQGPTKVLGLFRILLAATLWAEYGQELQLFRNHDILWPVHSIVFFIATAAMLIGFQTRLAMTITTVSMAVNLFFIDNYLGYDAVNSKSHCYLSFLITFYLTLSPCGRSLSVDRFLAVRRASKSGQPPPLEWGPLWVLTVIAFQISMVYFWVAYNKTNMPFAMGMRMEQIIMFFYTGSQDPQPGWVTFLSSTSGVTTLLLEYSLAVGLWFKRPRKGLMVAGLLFHAIIYLTLPVLTFSVLMAISYLAFLDPFYVENMICRFIGLPVGGRTEALRSVARGEEFESERISA